MMAALPTSFPVCHWCSSMLDGRWVVTCEGGCCNIWPWPPGKLAEKPLGPCGTRKGQKARALSRPHKMTRKTSGKALGPRARSYSFQGSVPESLTHKSSGSHSVQSYTWKTSLKSSCLEIVKEDTHTHTHTHRHVKIAAASKS